MAARSFTIETVIQSGLLMTTVGFGLFHALKRNIQQHRRWMIRSYCAALTFLQIRVILGVFGLDQPMDWHVLETVVWVNTALALLVALRHLRRAVLAQNGDGLVADALAHALIEIGEELIHQQDIRMGCKCARERNALLARNRVKRSLEDFLESLEKGDVSELTLINKETNEKLVLVLNIVRDSPESNVNLDYLWVAPDGKGPAGQHQVPHPSHRRT